MMKNERTTDPGKRVAEIRKARDMTLRELGEAIGKSRNTMWFYERGLSVSALLARLDPIAIALHCKRADLLAPPGSPIPPFRVRKKQPPPRLSRRLRTALGRALGHSPTRLEEAAFFAALKAVLPVKVVVEIEMAA